MTDLPPCQAASELRRLTDAALSAVAPDGAVLRHLHLDGGKLTLIDESGAPAWSGRLDAYRRIRVLGAGKGAAPMAAALENLLGDRISDGLVIVKYGHDLPEGQRTRHIRIKEGGHPVPDEAGAAAAVAAADVAAAAGAVPPFGPVWPWWQRGRGCGRLCVLLARRFTSLRVDFMQG